MTAGLQGVIAAEIGCFADLGYTVGDDPSGFPGQQVKQWNTVLFDQVGKTLKNLRTDFAADSIPFFLRFDCRIQCAINIRIFSVPGCSNDNTFVCRAGDQYLFAAHRFATNQGWGIVSDR